MNYIHTAAADFATARKFSAGSSWCLGTSTTEPYSTVTVERLSTFVVSFTKVHGTPRRCNGVSIPCLLVTYNVAGIYTISERTMTAPYCLCPCTCDTYGVTVSQCRWYPAVYNLTGMYTNSDTYFITQLSL